VAGWLADRFDRRRIIVSSHLAAAACSLALIATSRPVALVGIAFVASIVGRAGYPAFGAALPNVVGEERLEWANGTLGVAFNIGNLICPIVGGALYVAAGRSVVFAFDAVTYLVAALTVLWVLSTFSTLGLMANAIAFAMAGAIVEAFGPRAVFALGGVVSAACLLFLGPVFRERRGPMAAGYGSGVGSVV
jgi:MFS family permease